jgi:uncharacterized protein YjiS (DUF1127 family)
MSYHLPVTRSTLNDLSRVLYRHDWGNVEEWAHNIDKLAELSDFEIAELEHLARHQTTRTEGIARTSPPRQSLFVALFDFLGECQDRMRQRRQLMMLDVRALADIGISRTIAEAEYMKMPWRR